MSAVHNPSAFPVNAAALGGPGAYEPDPGMSLRDWFAGQFAPVMQANNYSNHPADRLTAAGIARASYAMADAMLAEREKRA